MASGLEVGTPHEYSTKAEYAAASDWNAFMRDYLHASLDFTGAPNLATKGDLTIPTGQTLTLINPITEFSIDGTFADNSDTALVSEKAIKEFVESSISFIAEYFYNDTASDLGGIYYEMLDTPTGQGESTFTSGTLTTGDDQALFNFATMAGLPGLMTLEHGVYTGHVHAEKVSGNKPVKIHFEIYSRTTGGVETLVATSEETDFITSKSEYDLHATLAADVSIATTDRLITKWLANVDATGSDVVVALYAEGTTSAHTSVPTSTEVLNSVFLRQDGTKPLTANWDAGSFGITAETFTSDIATGTAPLTVASTTVVTNLNASLLEGNAASAFAFAGGAFHDGFSDYVANEHIDHTSVTLTAGTNLNGGGDLSASRTINLDTNIVMADGATIGQAAGPLLTFNDSSNRFGITGCNVGINTLTPDAMLDVEGSIYVTNGSLRIDGATDAIIQMHSGGVDKRIIKYDISDDFLGFYNNGTTAHLGVDTSGNTCIGGVLTGLAKCHVQVEGISGSVVPGLLLEHSKTGAGASVGSIYLDMVTTIGSAGARILARGVSASDTSLEFYTYNGSQTKQLSIDKDGVIDVITGNLITTFGTFNFANDNLLTTGTLGAGAITGTSFTDSTMTITGGGASGLTFDMTSNTLDGTMAEFDTACSDGNFAYAGGAFHDGFSDYVADEHLPSSTFATAEHLHDGQTLQIAGINSDDGAFPFDTTGAVAFNQSVSSVGLISAVTTGDVLSLNGTGTANTTIRFNDEGVETAAIYTLNGANDLILRGKGEVQIMGGGGPGIDLRISALGVVSVTNQITSTLAIGTAPLAVTSTTLCTNLNADLWDGFQFSDYLDQAVKQASSPTFDDLTLTGGLNMGDTTFSTSKLISVGSGSSDYFTGVTQLAMNFNPQFTTAATSQMKGIVVELDSNIAGTWTTATVRSVEISEPDKGANHTITSNQALRINDQTVGTTNYAIYTGLGLVHFGDVVDLSGKITLAYLGAAPGSLTNGDVWMESDGLHIYYAGAEKVVAGV